MITAINEWLARTLSMSERAHWTLCLTIWHLGPVVTWFGVYTVCDAIPSVFRRWKIQQRATSNMTALALSSSARKAYNDQNQSEKTHGAAWRAAVRHTIVNHGIAIPLLWYTLGYNSAKQLNPDVVQGGTGALAWGRWLTNMAVAMLLEDALFYWSHRMLHDTRVYKYFHKRHHEFHTPASLAAEYAHPFEAMVGNFIPFLAGPIVTGMGMNEICAWFVVRMTKTAETHSGYMFPLAPFSIFPSWMITAAHHDFHHSQNKGYYGSFFRFWDMLCGTEGNAQAFIAKGEAERAAAHA